MDARLFYCIVLLGIFQQVRLQDNDYQPAPQDSKRQWKWSWSERSSSRSRNTFDQLAEQNIQGQNETGDQDNMERVEWSYEEFQQMRTKMSWMESTLSTFRQEYQWNYSMWTTQFNSFESRIASIEQRLDVFESSETGRTVVEEGESDRFTKTQFTDFGNRVTFLENKVTSLTDSVDKLTRKSGEEKGCENWKQYGRQKCLEILENKGTHEEAVANCKALNSTLISIESDEEQQLLVKLINDTTKVHNIWLGLEYKEGSFRWTEGSYGSEGPALRYENWADDAVREGGGHCAHVSLPEGEWRDDHCGRRYPIVCQKKSITIESINEQVKSMETSLVNHATDISKLKDGFSNMDAILDQFENMSSSAISKNDISPSEMELIQLEERMNTLIQKFKMELWQSINMQQNNITFLSRRAETIALHVFELRDKFSNMNYVNMTQLNNFRLTINQEHQELAIPIGYIYVQLPFEKPPTVLWPTFEWDDISMRYQGVFFRVVGGGAAEFGVLQDHGLPCKSRCYDSKVKRQANDYNENNLDNFVFVNGKPLYKNVEKPITWKGQNRVDWDFEVRPKNFAVKIWRRMK